MVIQLFEFGITYTQIKDYLFSNPDENVVERNDRLFQTYLIVFGLLISYGFDSSLQEHLMKSFMLFIWIGLIYYVFLSRLHKITPRVFLNALALIMGYLFSHAFIPGLCSLGPVKHEIFVFLFTTFLIGLSLFV